MTAALTAVLIGLAVIAFGLTDLTPRRLYIVAWLVCALLIGTMLVMRYCVDGAGRPLEVEASVRDDLP